MDKKQAYVFEETRETALGTSRKILILKRQEHNMEMSHKKLK